MWQDLLQRNGAMLGLTNGGSTKKDGENAVSPERPATSGNAGTGRSPNSRPSSSPRVPQGGGGGGGGRFVSATVKTMQELGSSYRPATVTGFGRPGPGGVVPMPSPEDTCWAYSRLGMSTLTRLYHSLRMDQTSGTASPQSNSPNKLNNPRIMQAPRIAATAAVTTDDGRAFQPFAFNPSVHSAAEAASFHHAVAAVAEPSAERAAMTTSSSPRISISGVIKPASSRPTSSRPVVSRPVSGSASKQQDEATKLQLASPSSDTQQDQALPILEELNSTDMSSPPPASISAAQSIPLDDDDGGFVQEDNDVGSGAEDEVEAAISRAAQAHSIDAQTSSGTYNVEAPIPNDLDAQTTSVPDSVDYSSEEQSVPTTHCDAPSVVLHDEDALGPPHRTPGEGAGDPPIEATAWRDVLLEESEAANRASASVEDTVGPVEPSVLPVVFNLMGTSGVLEAEDDDFIQEDDLKDEQESFSLDTLSGPPLSNGRPTSARPTSARPKSARPVSSQPSFGQRSISSAMGAIVEEQHHE